MAAPIDDALIEVVVPVYNEERALEPNVRALASHLDRHLPVRWRVVIADNASTDATPAVAAALAASSPSIDYLRLEQKGRGGALRAAWSASPADVVSYMDVDLSTNLHSFLPLVAPILSGQSEVAIGTRLAKGASVRRQLKREVLSRGYNALVHLGFGAGFSDAQCGFKALRADTCRELLPLVGDNGWFFDTELLLVAQRHRFRIAEVPVDWIEDLDSRVDIAATAIADLRGLWRVRRAFWEDRDRPGGARDDLTAVAGPA